MSDTHENLWAAGLAVFAGCMMLLIGILDIFQGITAIAKDGIYVHIPGYAFKFDTTSWGWIHLVLGVLVFVVGVGVLRAALWARFVGVFLVSLSVIGNFMFIPYYPIWALILIALEALVIWALCTYRSDTLA